MSPTVRTLPCGNEEAFPALPAIEFEISGAKKETKTPPKSQQKLSYRHGEMANPSGRPARRHPVVSDVFSTLAEAKAALDDVQRHLDLEFRASYPDQVGSFLFPLRSSLDAPPGARLTGSAAAVAGESSQAGGACEADPGGGGRAQGALPRPPRPEAGGSRLPKPYTPNPWNRTDPTVALQELIDKMQTSLAAQRSATRRLLAASGLPPVSEADAAAHNSLNEVIDEWTAHVRPITGRSPPI
jgi:hypothetical protein